MGGEDSVLKNNKGFIVAEGLVSLSAILLIATSLFPLMFLIIQKQEEGKRDLIAARLMYERTEANLMTGQSQDQLYIVDGRQYTITFQQGNEFEWKVCVNYDKKQQCIVEEYERERVLTD
ncbi:hypothetical protein B4102_1349 [Heyndrickxia sporothermodurans]|uniref:Type II secretion system protein n=1 Tax=Heyndrickxia sporothermodurans TaxID=46224 RepID=A0A150KM22_9BACI|nr:hypothetical protein B4102_1349 [Heyndrickxia sporothermodurans]